MFEFLRTSADRDKEAQETAKKITEFFEPELQSRQRQRDSQRVASICELQERREAIARERGETMPVLEAAATKAVANERQCHNALQTATQERVNATTARLAAALTFRDKLDSIEGEIRKLAHPAIDQFIHELLALWDKARNSTDIDERQTTNRVTGNKKTVYKSNVTAVNERVNVIRSAIAQANHMKLEPLSEDEIVEKLRKLQESLPPIQGVTIN